MFRDNDYKKKYPHRFEVSEKLYNELSAALHITEKDPDSQTLKDLIESYMKNEVNKPNEAEVPVIRSYITHKIQQQIATISKDDNNPLQDEANPYKTIIAYLYKIIFHVESINKENGFNDNDLKIAFTDKELPTVSYVISSCPFVSKDDEGSYSFVSERLLAQLKVDEMIDSTPEITAEDVESINELMRGISP